MPEVSIIVPVYNTEENLSQCLDCIINQTFTDFECICINDGSTDNSLSILEEYAKKDNRIRIISQANAGLSNVKNVGIKNAKGTYITFIDSDDFVSLDYVEKLYKYIDENNCDVVYCRHQLYYCLDNTYVSPKNEYKLPALAKKIKESSDQKFILTNLLYLVENARSSCMKMYRLDVIKNNNVLFFENIYAQCDYVHNILFAMYSLNNISFIDEELYYYRKQVKSISSDRDRMVINGLRSFIVLTKSLQERNLLKEKDIMHNFVFNGFIKSIGKKISLEGKKKILPEITEHIKYLKDNILKEDFVKKSILNFYLFIINLLGVNSFSLFRIIKNFYK